MKLSQFIEAVHGCGWRDTCDANHQGIADLHAKIFPVVSDLEKEIFATECEVDDLKGWLDQANARIAELNKQTGGGA